jgi:succinoglycan biosynthesis protein ExoM
MKPVIKSVCICACTFRRPEGLRAMLAGIAGQTFTSIPKPALQVVIADNEGSERARGICEAFHERSGIPLTYVHEPERGISFARNACLDRIPDDCDFFAFIDDDEVPQGDWLEKLIEAQARTGADVVQGPAIPVFAESAPKWLKNGDFLGWPRRNWRGTRLNLAEFEELPEAYTNNVLVRRTSVAAIGLRFDPAYALMGGGDTAFFRALYQAGNRIVYAPQAIVTETVPPERANLWYRLRVEYRIAINPLSAKFKKKNTRKIHRRVKYAWRDSGPQKIASGIGYFARSMLSGKLNMDRTVVACLRIAYGAGQSARVLRLKYHIYR